MTADTTNALVSYLVERRDTLVDQYTRLLRERIPFYQTIPEPQLREPLETMLRIFLEESLPAWDIGPSVAYTSKMVRLRAPLGLPRDRALALCSAFRWMFLRAAESLLEAKLPDVPRLLLFIDDYCEAMADDVQRFYDDALEAAQKELQQSEARYRELVELAPDGVIVHRDARFLYVNPAGARMLGTEASALVGTEVDSIFPPDRRETVRAAVRAAETTGSSGKPAEHVMMRADGEIFDVELSGATIAYLGAPARLTIFRDITERKRADEALKQAAVREQIIEAQASMLREMSTPLIPVSDGVVVMPLVGPVDPARAERIREVLLDGVSAAGAAIAIMDVTGVPTLDEDVAAALLSTVVGARLLGAEVVLTGIKPAAAQALVALGVDFGQTVTLGTLKDGIAHAFARARR